MSFQTFKANMNSYMSNQGGIGSYNNFALKLTTEYDMCIKRGFQTVNSIPILLGQNATMLNLVTLACTIALSKTEGLHTFADDIGKGVVAYWAGAQLQPGLPPPTPAVGAILNITTTAAPCTSPGTWTPVGPLNPTYNINLFLDLLIASMKQHLTTLVFTYSTISQYPGAPPPVAPGVLVAQGYTVPG